MRSDGILYTGVTSRSTTLDKIKEDKKEKQRLKQEKRSKIQTSADVILDELEKEKQKTVLKMLAAIETDTPDEQTKAIIVSLNLYKDTVNGLSAKIKNILREPK